MKKLVKDMTFADYRKYCNLRACDGNWDIGTALTCITFMRSLPKKKTFESKRKHNLRCESLYSDNKALIWNFEHYPNMKLDIETGEFELL